MEPTTLPPLVSDKALAQAHCLSDECLWLRLQYEADRLKTREVVQALVDYIAFRNSATAHPVVYYANGGKSYAQCLALAKSTLNIKPKQ